MRQILSLFVFTTLLMFSCGLFGQETTGVISGTVTDASGAVVPGATVTITNTDRNAVIRIVKTNQGGSFTAPLLPIGHYGVKIEAASFKTYDKTGIVLNVNDRLEVNAELQLGGHQEQVSVQADALQVQTQDATATGLINGTQVRELALRSRNYEELVRLMPGVTTDLASDTLYMGVSAPGGGTNEVAFSINGSLEGQNNWTVDGADNVDRGGNYTLLNYPSVDAIAEFKVLRGNYNAEFGRGAGGQVNVITRSGTSQFHGGLYEFFRNDALDANSWANNQQDIPKGPFRYNDFGGTIGGPIFIPGHYNASKNKTFFFFSEEIRRVVETDTNGGVEVPNAAERAGNFSGDCFVSNPDGSCAQYGPATTSISPAANAYLKDIYSHIALPAPGTNTITTDTRNTFNYRQEILRIDHQFNSKLSIFGRYMNDNIPTIESGGLFNGVPLPGIATTSTNSPGRSFIVTATDTFSPTLLNDLSFAYSYGGVISRNTGLVSYEASPDIAAIYQAPGILPYPTTLDRIPNISFSSGDTGIYGFGNYNDYNYNYSAFDNLTKVIGRHTLKFGAQYNWYEKHENAAGPNTGTFNFSGVDPDNTLGDEFHQFLLGQPQSYQQSQADVNAKIRQNVLEMYAQDEWRARTNLTISYGVRFSRFGSPWDANGLATNFNPSKFTGAAAPTIGYDGNLCLAADPTDTCAGPVAPNPNYDVNNGLIGPKVPNGTPWGQQVSSTPFYFAPRFGFAWDPFKDGKTAIRGGYGMFVDSVAVNIVENNVFTNPPFAVTNTFLNTSGTTLDNPAAGEVVVNGQAINNAVPSIGGLATNWKQPYTQQFDIDIQHQWEHGFLLDIGYYGSKGTHLFNYVDINQPQPGAYATNPTYLAALQYNGLWTPGTPVPQNDAYASAGLLNLLRPYPGYGSINVYEPTFSSSYNSLQSSLQKHFKGNNLLAVNYTWSKALSNLHFPQEYSVPQVTGDIQQDYGPTRFSRNQVFNANFVYEIPWLASEQGLIGHILGGWEASGIIQVESGAWLNPGTTSTADPGGVGIQFNSGPLNGTENLPDQVANPNAGAPHTAQQWFNTAAFVNPTGYAPGNARMGTILGPGIQEWDLSLFKNIKFTERLNMQFRAEAFNVFNHVNLGNPDTNLGDQNYGVITNAHDPRIMQLGLKLNF